MRRERLLHAACLLALFAGALIAFQDGLGADRGLFFRDHTLVFRPRWWWVSEAFHAGRLPALTHASTSGVPLETLLNATYTPAALLFFFGRMEVVYDLFVISHFLILGAGIYLLALGFGAKAEEALIAAAFGTLCGPVLSFENLVVGIQGLAYAPWVYLAFARVLKHGSPKDAGFLALAVGFHVQGIMPELLLLDVLAALAIIFVVRPRPTARLAGLLAIAGPLAAGLAAIELMPVLETLPLTRRGQGFDYADASAWPLLPMQLVELLAPNLWAPVDMPMIHAPALAGDATTPYFISLYVGASASLFAIPSLLAIRRRSGIAAPLLLTGALIATIVAMGPLTPLHRLFASLPILKSARYPVKYMLITSACLAATLPLALQALSFQRRALIACAGLQVALLGALAISVSSSELAAFLDLALDKDYARQVAGLAPSDLAPLMISAMKPRVFHALAFSAVLFGIAVGVGLRSSLARFFGPALAVLVLLDLAFAARFVIRGADLEPAAPPVDVVEKVASPHHRLFNVIPNGEPVPVPHREGRTYLEEQLYSGRQRGYYLDADRVRRFEDLDSDAQSNPTSAEAFFVIQDLRGARARRLLARAGVAWISSSRPDQVPGVSSYEIAGEPPQYVFPLPEKRPYVRGYASWKVGEVATLSDHDFAKLFSGKEDWGTALLPEPSRLPAGLLSAATSSRAAAECEAASETTLLESGVERVVIDHQAPCPMIVVALETFTPGWTGSIDGQPRAIFPAEIGSLAIDVPPGKHVIRFEYVPRVRRWAQVSLLSLLLSLPLFFVRSRRPEVAGLRMMNSISSKPPT